MSSYFVDTIIIGTGFSGLCVAKNLIDRGITDFILLERSDDIGGTWRDNDYPGAACDIPSHLYSYSFFQNPDWHYKFPRQPELFAYTKAMAKHFDLEKYVKLNHEVTFARFDEEHNLWHVSTPQGEFSCHKLVSCVGPLSDGKLPDIDGVDTFKGHAFHSSKWDHSYDLTGKKVAVIGTGASAIQFVPEIVKTVDELHVYQRTPPWIIPRGDRKITKLEKWLYKNVRWYQKLIRKIIYWEHEVRVVGIIINPALMKIFQKLAKRHLNKQVSDQALKDRITPDYTIGCKRILISNDWYPALQKPNCDLIDVGIQRITEDSLIDNNGVERKVDAIIYNTGFFATNNPAWENFVGKDNLTLAKRWEEGEEAYLSTTVSGFPNFFIMNGPNMTLGHSSMIYMIESQTRHVVNCLEAMKNKQLKRFEVKEDVLNAYNKDIQKKLEGTIWSTGCQSWYKNANGKITALWPSYTFSFRRLTAQFNLDDFHTC